jgi:hypothetical protein
MAMFKTAAFIFVFLALVSCQKSSRPQSLEQNQEALQKNSAVKITERIPATVVPKEAGTWDADIYFVNFGPQDQAKVESAVSLMKKVISSPEFKEAVLGHTYKGEKTYVDNKGLSNEEIYRIIIDGAEEMGVTTKNNRLDVELELYRDSTTTIGYTYPDSTRIWMNLKYFQKYTPLKVAGNLMHEWMHKLGFGHELKYNKDRDYSVPYAIGYLLEKMAKQYQ